MPLQVAPEQTALTYAFYYLVLPIAYILLLTVYGTKVQFWFMMNEVSKALIQLRHIRDRGLKRFDEFVKTVMPSEENRVRVYGMLDYFTVFPVSLDPVGIVKKLKHLLDTQDHRVKSEITDLLGKNDILLRNKTLGFVSAAAALNFVYKVINHFVSLTKRYSSVALLQQLYAIMPLLIKQTEAILEYMDALDKGVPIGDGIGPLSVALLMNGKPKIKIAEDTVASVVDMDGRKVVLVKAEGPANNLGKLDDALRRILMLYNNVSAVITIDAMLRLESEKSGEVANGVGVAIGGIGVERFTIEEEVTKRGIPTYAIGIKQTFFEAISVMTKDIAESVDNVHRTLMNVIKSKTPANSTVVVVGVGNTLGVGQ